MAAPEHTSHTNKGTSDFNTRVREEHKRKWGHEKPVATNVATFNFAEVLKQKSTISECLKDLDQRESVVDTDASFGLSMPIDLTASVCTIAELSDEPKIFTVDDLKNQLEQPLTNMTTKELELALSDLQDHHETCSYRSPLKSNLNQYPDLEKYSEAGLKCFNCSWSTVVPGAWQKRITVRCENCKTMLYTKELRLIRKQAKRILDFVETQKEQSNESTPISTKETLDPLTEGVATMILE